MSYVYVYVYIYIYIEEGDFCVVTFPIGLCATSRFRMQAKFGKTMQKAMSHKMELHTKAGGACKVVIQPLKIPNIRRVLHLVIFSVCWAGSRASSQNRAHHSIQVGVLPPVARFFLAQPIQHRSTATLATFSLFSEWPP